MRALLARLALSLAGVVLALALAEAGLRLAGAGPARFHRPRQLESADKRAGVDAYPSDPRGYFDLDLRDAHTRSELAARGIPDLARAAEQAPHAVAFAYNAELCRDREFAPRAPGVARVIALGDSFTEGQGVREGDTFARRLEGTLRARGRSVEVFNCGRRGRDFPALFDAFEQLYRREPDVVLYAMVLNDPVQSPEFRARQAFLNDWIVDRRRTLGDDDPGAPSFWSSRVLSLAQDRLEAARVANATTRWYLDMFGAPNRDGWLATQRYLARMNDAMRARGGRLVVALLPLLVGLDGRYPFEQAAREVRDACARLGIPFVDVLPALRGNAPGALWVHPVDLHPNERAHALIAGALAPALEAALPAQ